MPKAGYASKDLYHLSLGFQEGWAEIIGAKTAIVQFPPNKKTNRQSPPFLAQVVTFQKTDENGVRTGEDPITNEIKIEGFGDSGSLKLHPGLAASRTDQNPQDLGEELGTEGNCIYSDGPKVSDKSPWGVFSRSLEEKGFRADILGEGYSPDLVGVKGYFTQLKGEKFKAKDTGEEIEPNFLVCSKLTVRPYEQTGKPGSKRVSTAPAGPAGKVNGSGGVNGTNGAGAATGAATPSPDVNDQAVQFLLEVAGDLTGKSTTPNKLYTMLFSRLSKSGIPRAEWPAYQSLFKSGDWLTEQLSLTGHEFDGETATFV